MEQPINTQNKASNSKLSLGIDSVIKLGVITSLVIAASTKQEYSYYSFLRWVVMITSIYFAYKSYKSHQIGLLIYFAAIVILFNPFQKFWFQKETWHVIDYLISIITALTNIQEWRTYQAINILENKK